MEINLGFRNEEQKQFFWHRERNGGFGGAFGNGKSYVGCERAFCHLATFPNYGMTIGRQKLKVLKATTMKTFFKICPRELVHIHNAQDGYTILINKSFIYWMHLDSVDEQDLRGLEINSVLLDQVEEVEESIYNVLDFRVGRWDKAEVPEHLLLTKVPNIYKTELMKMPAGQEKTDGILKYTTWPKTSEDRWGRFIVPNYMDCLWNPSDDDEYHWSYRYYNPLSEEKKRNHFYIERKTDDSMNDAGTIEQALSRDKEWVDKYYYGITGSPKAIIHKPDQMSEINPEDYEKSVWDSWFDKFIKKAYIIRVLDHGESGITACGWFGAYKGVHIFYREYYKEGHLISYHRKQIIELSFDDDIQKDLADPQIFKITGQKKEGFFTVAQEYADVEDIDAPAIYWLKADNNEYATRNRINELLAPHISHKHPITNVGPAPALYYIKRCDAYPFGVQYGWNQLKAQRRTLVGEVNGKKIYMEERDPKVIDHAYDLIRYDVAEHNVNKGELTRKPPKKSFAYFNAILARRKAMGNTPASLLND